MDGMPDSLVLPTKGNIETIHEVYEAWWKRPGWWTPCRSRSGSGGRGLHKSRYATIQPGRFFKDFGVAKRRCSIDSFGDTLGQRRSFPHTFPQMTRYLAVSM